MSRTLLVTFGIGIVVIAIAVAAIFYTHRGAHLELPGKISRPHRASGREKLGGGRRLSGEQPLRYSLHGAHRDGGPGRASGNQIEGQTSSDIDAQRLMAGIPLLGPKYNPSLIVRDKVPPHGSLDRMVAARFEVPEATLQTRKRFLVRIEEIDGLVVEYSEK